MIAPVAPIVESACYEALKDTALGRTVVQLHQRGFSPFSIREIVRNKGGTPELCAQVENMAHHLTRLEEAT